MSADKSSTLLRWVWLPCTKSFLCPVSVVTYPEIRSRVAAVVSAAGGIGGSALANDAEQYQADLLRHFPGATCRSGDGGAVESLRPATRQAWLVKNPLPSDLRYSWAISMQITGQSRRRLSRGHPMTMSMFVTQNAYPREALLVAPALPGGGSRDAT